MGNCGSSPGPVVVIEFENAPPSTDEKVKRKKEL